jgi:hypothetical protein
VQQLVLLLLQQYLARNQNESVLNDLQVKQVQAKLGVKASKGELTASR